MRLDKDVDEADRVTVQIQQRRKLGDKWRVVGSTAFTVYKTTAGNLKSLLLKLLAEHMKKETKK